MNKKISVFKYFHDVFELEQPSKLKNIDKPNHKVNTKSLRVKRKPFSKPIRIKTATKPYRLYYFRVAGMRYVFKNIKSFEKVYDRLSEGDVLTIKHENKNKFDPCACEIYHKKIKLGYIPKEFNSELLYLAKKGKTFLILIHKLYSFSEFYDSYKAPEVVILVY